LTGEEKFKVIIIIIVIIMLIILLLLLIIIIFLEAATLAEVFPCFFLGCNTNVRV